jgi:hypothetical protein
MDRVAYWSRGYALKHRDAAFTSRTLPCPLARPGGAPLILLRCLNRRVHHYSIVL